jgi:alpha-amylase/alpha-mannosidase (GH57 family)
MERFICIHGHFYQPPRENPWLEEIEIQDSSYPYHDWNERVTSECYAPNSASRLLDGEGRIIDIVSNYVKISFNFGPTLLSWMEKHAPETYSAILEADRQSVESRAGHGNAIAQGYNHLIMPLANSRDKRTQIRWGIRDFVSRYKRTPEGMWLPETAVDMETLDILAEEGIKFTILSSHQASKVRKIGTGKWKDLSGGQIDPSRAYLCSLPSGRRLSVFFYDGPIARAVAFEKLLGKGEDFVNRILKGFSDERQWPQIVNIATDGESYGHHHKFGDMALAYVLHHIEAKGLARLTNYGEYLEKNPPLHEVQIYENTSWSCVHGIERWRGNCGCNTGGNHGWNQEWRAPLREALDWLRDELASLCEERTREYLKNPWTARDEYLAIILDRSKDKIEDFLARHAARALTDDEKTSVFKVMELQRHAMLMYTSCGWFFDELSGIETLQIIQYAGRAVQLAKKLFGIDLEDPLKARLEKAKANLAEYRDGAHIYEKFVKPAMIDLKRVAVHYAISSLIRDYADIEKIYCFSVKKEDYQVIQSGATKLAIGRLTLASDITFNSETISCCALYLGGHAFNGGAAIFPSDDAYEHMKQEIITTFEKEAIADIIRLMDSHFGTNTYSLMHLFREEQRKILSLAINETMEQFEHAYRLLYENNRTLMAFLHEAGMPVPEAFRTAAAFTLNLDLKRACSEEMIDSEKIRGIVTEINKLDVSFDSVSIEFMLRRKCEGMIGNLCGTCVTESELSMISGLHTFMEIVRLLPVDLNYWQIQNIYYKMAKTVYREFLLKAKEGDSAAVKWLDVYRSIGEKLSFNTASVLSEN